MLEEVLSFNASITYGFLEQDTTSHFNEIAYSSMTSVFYFYMIGFVLNFDPILEFFARLEQMPPDVVTRQFEGLFEHVLFDPRGFDSDDDEEDEGDVEEGEEEEYEDEEGDTDDDDEEEDNENRPEDDDEVHEVEEDGRDYVNEFVDERRRSVEDVRQEEDLQPMPPHNLPPPVPHHHHSHPQTHSSTTHHNSTTISSAASSVNTTSTTSKTPEVAAPAAPSLNKTMDNVGRVMQLNGHVGFDSLPHQLVKKAVEAGFQFNLMCVGETGMGKTTLIESLFNMKLDFEPCNHELKTVELRTKTYDVAEGGIRVKLRLVETAGFGDQLDKDKSAKVIVDFLESQFENYLQEELKPRRMLQCFDDSRIHACLYFISPSGHGLKALDLVTLRELAKRVNVIPVIAKSDTTCKDELLRFKAKILSELKYHKIELYSFPTDDETVSSTNQAMNTALPFAVVGSCDFVKKENGQMVRARQYPWGIVEVENEQHCDFVKLREALLRTNFDEMRQRTHESLYENYRRDRLRQMKIGDGETGPKIIEKLAQKHREYQDEFSRRELSLREEFQKKLDHTESEMRKVEEALAAREREVQDEHEQEAKKLDAELRQLTEERLKLLK